MQIIFLCVFFYPKVERNKDSLNSKNLWCQLRPHKPCWLHRKPGFNSTCWYLPSGASTQGKRKLLVLSKGGLLYLNFTSPEVVPYSAGAVLVFQYLFFLVFLYLQHLLLMRTLNCTSTLGWIHVPAVQKQTLTHGNCWHLPQFHSVAQPCALYSNPSDLGVFFFFFFFSCRFPQVLRVANNPKAHYCT